MSYKINKKIIAVEAVVLIVFWIFRASSIYKINDFNNVLPFMIGTSGGYMYHILVSGIILPIILFVTGWRFSLYDDILIVRYGRVKNIKYNVKNLILDMLIYVGIYVAVPIIYYLIMSPYAFIRDKEFHVYILLYLLALYIVSIFLALIYIDLCCFVKKSYIALAVTIVFGYIISELLPNHLIGNNILFGGTSVIDILKKDLELNPSVWLVYRLIDIVLIAIVYVHTVEHYRQMDIMKK